MAGYIGGAADEAITGAIDVMLTLPFPPLTIILAAYLGPSLNNIVLVLAFFGWSGFARIVRAQVGYAFHQGPWLWEFAPGLGIALLGAGFALLGITIEERVNPRLRFSRR